MIHMKRKEFNHKGDCYVLVSEALYEGVNEIMASAWVDYDILYVILTIASFDEGQAVLR